MVQTTGLRNTDDASLFGRLYRSWFGCVLVQRQVTAAVMVVVDKGLELARQAGWMEHDHVIQALSANGANHPFDIGALPGRPWGRQDLLDAHRLHLLDEMESEDEVPTPEDKSRPGLARQSI